ncbi:MAG: GPR endopeptidase [Clostridia bacterium]|nr:GPR endopeptidase [Clostridia bacterium]
MRENIRTDLAIEVHEMLTEAAEEITGVSVDELDEAGVHIARVKIENLAGERKMGKPVGSYVTVEFPGVNIAEGEDYEQLCHTVAKELSALLPLSKESRVLVVGLGNRDITPDALGPKVVEKLMVTRHLFQYVPDAVADGLRPVCAISPGVLGTTGMETGEIIRGVTDKIRPDAVVVIDALAARSVDRISCTVQLCNTGISPGSGVGNTRKALNKSTLGVPVIAVGVPLVVDAVTVASDAIGLAAENRQETGGLENMEPEERRAALTEALPESLTAFMVTPKEIDLLVERVSKVVANGINFALHENISFADIEAYLA